MGGGQFTVKTSAWLFQAMNALQPGAKIPMLTVYVPVRAVSGTEWVAEYVRVCPALKV